jgi:hypothetical protein
MPPIESIAGSTPISVLKRRIAGKKEWRVGIEEVIASYRSMMARLRAIRNLHPNDAALQGLVADTLEGMIEALITLNELYHYSDGKVETNGLSENSGGA